MDISTVVVLYIETLGGALSAKYRLCLVFNAING